MTFGTFFSRNDYRSARNQFCTRHAPQWVITCSKTQLYFDEMAAFLWDKFDVQATRSSISRAFASKGRSKGTRLLRLRRESIISTYAMNTPTLSRIYTPSTLCMFYYNNNLHKYPWGIIRSSKKAISGIQYSEYCGKQVLL